MVWVTRPTRPARAQRTVTLARDRPKIPYLGTVEDHYRASWDNAWLNLRARMRTPQWATGLDHAMAGGTTMATIYVEEFVHQAANDFHRSVRIVYARVLDQAAADGVADAVKATGRRSGASPGRSRAVLPARSSTRSPRPLTLVEKARGSAARAVHVVARRPVRAKVRVHDSGLPTQAHAAHLAAADRMSLKLIADITERQREAVRRILARSIRRGIEADKVAAQVSDVVGLFPSWQQAADNFLVRMLTNDVPGDVAYDRAQRYADELLRKRGLMIARTELMRALNDGRLLGWRLSAQEGWVDAGNAIKLWVSQPDACDECLMLSDPNASGEPAGVVQGIDTPFETPLGPVLMPPLHPHCRCTVTLLAGRPGIGNEAIEDDSMNDDTLNDTADAEEPPNGGEESSGGPDSIPSAGGLSELSDSEIAQLLDNLT